MTKTAKPIIIAAHFPDEIDAKRVKRAAKKAGVTVSTFVREAVSAKAAEVLGSETCPACGGRVEAA